jgi:hypothetical protein
MDENSLYAGMLGAFIKHVIPTPKVNRFIPVISYAAMFGLNVAKTGDVKQAFGKSLTDVLGAMGGHKVMKTTVLGDARIIPGRNGERNKL